ncbi:hypothetical protein GCM10027187_18960 [Streptosporangium sandarakinum]
MGASSKTGCAEGCPPTREGTGALCEEPHHLVDQVPEAELGPASASVRCFPEEYEEGGIRRSSPPARTSRTRPAGPGTGSALLRAELPQADRVDVDTERPT